MDLNTADGGTFYVSPLSERAVRYVRDGWALLPLVPRGKEPHRNLLRDIYNNTTLGHLRRAPALGVEVEYWFENDPDINVGVFPQASGLVICDIDRLDLFDLDLVTPTVRSGRVNGGKHLYFRSDEPVATMPMEWGHVNPAHAVVAGSMHESGSVYEWMAGLSPEDVPFMDFDEARPFLGLD